MVPPVEEVYFTWLCDRIDVNFGKPTTKTYNDLLGILHSKEFVWVVPNDDNRLEDAMDLRYAFLNESGIMDPNNLLMGDPPFSVLEVIIGLSDRLAFIDGGTNRNWAWRLVDNLDLTRYNDPVGPRRETYIDDILEGLIWRTYQPDGIGGFFPLAFPQNNQTKVEIWYQMAAYLDEQIEH
jgi:hypothetical protein